MLVDNRGGPTRDAAFYSDTNTPKVCIFPYAEGVEADVVPECTSSNPNTLGSIRSFETPFMSGVLQVRLPRLLVGARYIHFLFCLYGILASCYASGARMPCGPRLTCRPD